MSAVIASSNIEDLIPQYDAFIVDLWGVIHDGIELYPNVTSTLKILRDEKKQVIFLSNAPRRAKRAQVLLDKFDILPEYYVSILTSGEVTYDYVKNHPEFSLAPHYYIGPDKDKDLFDGLDTKTTTDPSEAGFVVVTGFENDKSTADEKNIQLRSILKHQLPLLCANPDMAVVRHSGQHALCAGVIAEAYETMGGKVTYFGKPYEQVYQRCFSLFDNVEPKRIAAIGDSLSHDIRGANNAGIDSYLVLQGIHAKELNFSRGKPIDKLLFEYTCQSHKGTPTGVLEHF